MNDDSMLTASSIKSFLSNNAGYISVIFIAAAYIATSMLMINSTGKSVIKIIGDGISAFLVGILITRSFSLQGIVKGTNDPRVVEARKGHADQILAIEPYIDQLDDWCDKKTAVALRRERTKILAVHSMKYSDFFDDDGVAKPYVALKQEGELSKKQKKLFEKREKKREGAYHKAVDLVITPLSASVLTGGKYRQDDPYNFGADIEDFERTNTRKDMLSKLFIGIVFGYYAVELLAGISIADTLWKVFQLCIFCGGGVVQMMKSYMYMTIDYCKRLLQLTGRLKEFEASREKNKEEKKEYVVSEV